MSGIDVLCGDFSGGDKSCSALGGVAIGVHKHLGTDAATVEAFARLEALIAAPLNEFENYAYRCGATSPINTSL
jgi:hypothetical protein